MIANIVLEVMILAAIVATALMLARRKAGVLSPPLTLTTLARVAGGLTLVLGAGHLLDVGGGIIIGRRPYTLRNVEILWIGGILVFSGLINLLFSSALRRGENLAWRASGAATLLVWLFTLSLLPITTGGSMDSSMNRVLFLINSGYLGYWVTHRLGTGTAPEDSRRSHAAGKS